MNPRAARCPGNCWRIEAAASVRGTPRGLDSGGSALLEVLLALALLVGAAAVTTSALNSSLASLERQRLVTQATQLAASAMAEIQLGIRPLAADGRRPLPAPFQEWSCEVALVSGAGGGLEASGSPQVEVIVRHEAPPIVQRLAQTLRRESGTKSAEPAAEFQSP